MLTNNRGSKVLITFLIITIGILATSTGYLFAKNSSLQKNLDTGTTKNTTNEDTDIKIIPSVSVAPSATPSATTTASPTPTPSATATKTPTATTGEKYTVKAGDTMYSIALKYNLNWIKLAEANGLTEQTANNIKIGQVLVIPSK